MKSDSVAEAGRSKSKTAAGVALTIPQLHSSLPDKTLIHYNMCLFSSMRSLF
jgi:hypothetical protein